MNVYKSANDMYSSSVQLMAFASTLSPAELLNNVSYRSQFEMAITTGYLIADRFQEKFNPDPPVLEQNIHQTLIASMDDIGSIVDAVFQNNMAAANINESIKIFQHPKTIKVVAQVALLSEQTLIQRLQTIAVHD